MSLYTPDKQLQFPENFLFGAATAAYQIEGAVTEDGRGQSIWDVFSHTAGRVHKGDNGDVACDHYHRWEQDLDLLVSLGVDAYRFSIAWPRVYPQGNGKLNRAGLDFYDRLIDGCVERGIKVFATLYHWDLPQALYLQGGWMERSTADAFARYAQLISEKLGDRIDALATFNEPWCSSILSHLMGIHAPGERNLENALAVVHGQHRAHGLAVQAMRATRPDLPLGIVLNAQAVRPASESTEDQTAAERHRAFHNGLFLDPLFCGKYPDSVVESLADKMPADWQADMVTIHQPLDYWGLNYYTPEYVTDGTQQDSVFPSTRRVSLKNVPRTDIGWHVDASALSELLLHLNQQYDLPTCYITENGAAYNQQPVDGIVNDQGRVDYLRDHLLALRNVMDQGIDIRGYFAWSLMDNFEWAEGYSMRFGLIHVNYSTQERVLKNSALWYRELIADHRQKSAQREDISPKP